MPNDNYINLATYKICKPYIPYTALYCFILITVKYIISRNFAGYSHGEENNLKRNGYCSTDKLIAVNMSIITTFLLSSNYRSRSKNKIRKVTRKFSYSTANCLDLTGESEFSIAHKGKLLSVTVLLIRHLDVPTSKDALDDYLTKGWSGVYLVVWVLWLSQMVVNKIYEQVTVVDVNF